MEQYRRALTSPNEDDCMQALMELAYIEEPWADNLIAQTVNTPFQGIRSFLIDIIAERHSQEMIDIIATYLNSEIIEIRNFAGKVLVTLGSDSVTALQKALNHPSHAVRQFAVDCLREIGKPSDQVIEDLAQHLNDPQENVNVKYSICETMAKIGNTAYIPMLKKLADNQDIGYMALYAIGMIGGDESIPFLLEQFDNGDDLRKFAVAEVFCAIQSTTALDILYDLLDREEGYLQTIICKAIASTMREGQTIRKHREIFQRALADDDCKVRTVITRALSFDGSEFSRAILVDCLDNACADVREIAFDYFRSNKNIPGERMLEQYSSFGTEGRKNCLLIIGECNLSDFENIIIQALHDDNSELRELAAFAYGKFADARHINELRNILLSESVPEVQIAFIRALGWHRDDEAVPMLLDLLLKTEDTPTCDAIIGSLVLIGGELTINALTGYLHDVNTPVHLKPIIITALGYIGEIQVVHGLKAFIDDEDPAIREKVIVTLARLRAVEYTDLLVASLNDENPVVREAAFEALILFNDKDLLEYAKVIVCDDEPWLRYKAFKTICTFLPDHQLEDFLIAKHHDAEGLDKIAVIQAFSKSSLNEKILLIIREVLVSEDRDQLVEALNIIDERLPAGLKNDITVNLKFKQDPFIMKKITMINKKYSAGNHGT